VDILPGNAQKKLESIEKKLIIDVSTDVEDTIKIVKGLREKVGSNKVLTVVVIPSGSSHYYSKKLLETYGSLDPIVAFTKLDENNISAEELSVIAEKKCSIGYLTDTRSILKSINFTNKEILAQYLKDNIINFCK
jgi:flagellar biosynthesis GTPase FlhF